MTDLETLERLLAAATPGPWKYLSARWPYEVWSEAAGAALGLPSAKLLELWSSHEDGEFIVALVNAAPGLLTELKELLRIRDEQSEYVHVLEETVTELNVGALELERELQAARNVVEAAHTLCNAIDDGFAAKIRPDIARSLLVRALNEYSAVVAEKVTPCSLLAELKELREKNGPCTCGSGAHPRECNRHPLGKELHAAELSIDALNDDVASLERELQAARNVVELVRRGGCCFATFSEECEKTREAVAAIAEYDAAVAGKVTT